ncbi:MAG: transporter substrate-binding domain-containing protein, partial [Flavobacteriales bacterium]|nr:transporter substrate-binding domain-containing protein [Flavobacteriales bacterium]
MKKIYKAFALILSVLFSFLTLNAKPFHIDSLSQKTIIIESDRDFPPYEFINENGVPDGFNVDLIKALMNEVGLHYKLTLDNWSDVMKHLEQKKIDMVGGLMYSYDRSTFAKFGIPHSYISQVLVVRHGSSIKKLRDLQGKTIIIQDQDRAAESLMKLNMDYDSIIYTHSTEAGLSLLSNGVGDVVICSDILASYLIAKNKINNIEIIKSISLDSQKYSFAVNTDNDELLYRLNSGLLQLKISGEYDRIYDKWFSVYEKKDFSNIIWIIVSIVVILTIISFSFIMLLRDRIKKSTASLQKTAKELKEENKQRTASEEKLQRTLRQLGLAISAGNISAWHYDIDKSIFSSIYGHGTFFNNYTYVELVKIIHPNDRNEFEKIFGKIIKGEEETATINFRLLIEPPDTYRYYEDKIMCIKNVYGSPINIIGTHKDVTSQLSIQKRLTDYKTKMEFITTSAQMITWEYDVRKHILYSFTENSLIPTYH